MIAGPASDALLPAPPAAQAPSPQRSRRFDDADLVERYFTLDDRRP
jgi:hypothetical protein